MFILKIETENDAFLGGESKRGVGRLLQVLAAELRLSERYVDDCGVLLDVNGNMVGRWAMARRRAVPA